MKVLAELCGDDRLHYELTRELLSITLQQRSTARRAGLHEALEKTFTRHFYENKADAVSRAQMLMRQKVGISQNRPQNIPIAMEPLAHYEESKG